MTSAERTGTTPPAGRRQARLVIYRGVSDVASKGVMFVVTVLAARWMPRAEFAVCALATTLGWLASVGADFGVQVHLARAVAQAPPSASALLSRWLPVRLVTGLLALGVSVVVIAWLEPDHAALLPMVVFSLAYAASGFGECFYYVFRALDRSDVESTLTLAGRGTLLLLAPPLIWWRPTALSFATAMLVPALAASAAALWWTRRLVGSAAPFAWPGADVQRDFFAHVAPIGLGALLSALYFRIDVFLIERWSGAGQVAAYNAVFRLVDALRLFPAAVLAVALPRLFTARSLVPVLRVAAPLTAGAVGAAAILALAAPVLIPTIYGPGFVDGIVPFRILVLALPLMSLNGALTHQLIGWNGHRAYAWLCALALGANLLLNWSFIPQFGATGAAWVTVWTEVVLSLGCVAALARALRAPSLSSSLEVPS